MINGQREIWISTGNKANSSVTIIAVSNCGRIMRKNGKIENASYGQQVFVGEKRLQMCVYSFLAKNFIKKSEDDILKQRTFIDHITHKPDNMYINDIRNLRWCTNKENCNFPEAKLNYSKIRKGKKHSAETKAKMSAAKISEKNAMYRKKHSAESKEKMSAARKGLRWFNNGITSIRTKECPDGFVPGRIYKRKAAK